MVNEKSVGKIELEITVSLALEGFTLKIQDGKIKEILTGSCKGEGSVKCENVVLLEKELAPISLPGSIDLGEGLPIQPHERLGTASIPEKAAKATRSREERSRRSKIGRGPSKN